MVGNGVINCRAGEKDGSGELVEVYLASWGPLAVWSAGAHRGIIPRGKQERCAAPASKHVLLQKAVI